MYQKLIKIKAKHDWIIDKGYILEWLLEMRNWRVKNKLFLRHVNW